MHIFEYLILSYRTLPGSLRPPDFHPPYTPHSLRILNPIIHLTPHQSLSSIVQLRLPSQSSRRTARYPLHLRSHLRIIPCHSFSHPPHPFIVHDNSSPARHSPSPPTSASASPLPLPPSRQRSTLARSHNTAQTGGVSAPYSIADA